jgi:hypothetical protein
MQILSALGDKTDYTWGESLKFFVLGALWAALAACGSVGWALWHNFQNYSDPIDWGLIQGIAASSMGPALAFYWQSHKNLLKLPPWFEIPAQFQPIEPPTKGGTGG